MAILTCQQIKERIYDTSDPLHRLVVTPLLEPESQLDKGSSSLDIRPISTSILPILVGSFSGGKFDMPSP